MRILVSCLVLPLLFAVNQKSPTPEPSGPIVQSASGPVRGQLQGTTAAFKGIPFAAAPVGDLRWREPQPVAQWTAVRDAVTPGHPCTQRLAGTDTYLVPIAAAYGITFSPVPVDPSEDCLYLNVWSPQLQPGAHLPVMVWLHGGSNRVGSGSEVSYDGTSLASHGVIVVTVNYRLGVMGFFSHPELTAESPHHSSGDYGLLDQIAALQWVQKNISQFGGDPGNVTLFGESAGSVDATSLMTSPLAANLFRRIIAESGPAFGLGPARDVAYMEPLGVAVGKEAGAQPGAQLKLLRSLPAAQIVQIEDRLVAGQFKGYDPNAPIVDGWVLPKTPARAFASGSIQKVDLLVGLNAREFSGFRVNADAAAKKANPPPPKPSLTTQIKLFADTTRPLYGDRTDLAVAASFARILIHGTPALDQASNDMLAACPIGAEAALTTQISQHAFVYRFERSVPGKGEPELGSFHALEIPYVFNAFGVQTWNWLPFTATDHKLSQTMQTYWTNFARTGDPNSAGVPRWTAWTADEPYMAFTEDGDAVPRQSFSPEFCHLAPSRLQQQLSQ